MVRSDGSCVHLDGSSRCSIYADRPAFCRVDDGIEANNLDRVKAYQATADLCNRWMAEDGIQGKFVQLTFHGASSSRCMG
jgi:Fe-S-cluster containining protein